MNNRLGLFRDVLKGVVGSSQKRKLYTDGLYAYPNSYFNNVVYPSQVNYRETWHDPPTWPFYAALTKWGMRFFWTLWFWQLFHHPEAILGHFDIPDPTKWTDSELGVPPDEAGSYADWLKANGLDTERN